mmetsp:Transcript_28384/g.37119  ORF Transcript_28384/g.37119 Transcript_28384/m.37119 type:complete len:574 (-) Transcript_28384:328-2049(-)|eukprot:CAMPEP_0117753148 /NCGR_PEP_ID=MMETSP0947-20121206/12048_1 /TAXON_ID=44440 /ORGANISM="Chattonella subsalsa, Strain CCMP2191" /LENGTH=573 /DNA_ID=CAMNT_0005571965 /DNA_START=237 /DNA_END=1958 /DNA_ORIENTATION=-
MDEPISSLFEDKNAFKAFVQRNSHPLAPHLCKEDDEGDTEYKLKLVEVSPERFLHLKTQLNFRLNEGNNHCTYQIGYHDGGFPEGLTQDDLFWSLHTLCELAIQNQAKVVDCHFMEGINGLVARVGLMRVSQSRNGSLDAADATERCVPPLDVRVAVAGSAQVGKSTLIGVLTKGNLDNGRGLARMQVFQHNHEVETGTTSSISHQTMCLDNDGNVMSEDSHGCEFDQKELFKQSSKVITFMDLPGAPKHLKTTVFGLTAQKPDFVLLCVTATNGLQRMTREHLGIALALKVPIWVVVTKTDRVPAKKTETTIQLLKKIFSSPAVGKRPVVVTSKEDVNFDDPSFGAMAPIFPVSSVSGQGLSVLRQCVAGLRSSRTWDSARSEPLELHVEDYFQVCGVGTVYAGTLHQGSLHVGQEVFVGPDRRGHFCPALVRSVHNAQRASVAEAHAGQSVSVALALNRPDQAKFQQSRKGLVIVEPSLLPTGVFEFDAEVLLLHHPKGVAPDYQSVVHANTIRQAAKITSIHNKEKLKSGDKAVCRFRFLYHPEYIIPGITILFREGFTRGIGKVLSVHG